MTEDRKNDIKRIQNTIISNGYTLSLNQCEVMWRDYSDSFSSTWLTLPPEDKALWVVLKWRVIKYYN